jgi:hypothetical protein
VLAAKFTHLTNRAAAGACGNGHRPRRSEPDGPREEPTPRKSMDSSRRLLTEPDSRCREQPDSSLAELEEMAGRPGLAG